jgi:hypothetical protein
VSRGLLSTSSPALLSGRPPAAPVWLKLDDQKTLDPHRALGFILTEPAALLLLICALLAWLPERRLRRVSIALPFLIFVQAPLSWGGRWSGMFHPLNAFLILGVLGWFSRQLWNQRAEVTEQTAPAAA